MINDPKEEKDKEEKALVSELFKLLDTWEREKRRRKPSQDVAGIAAGASFVEDKRRN